MPKNISKNAISFYSEKEIRDAKFNALCDILCEEGPSEFVGMLDGVITAHLAAHNVPMENFINVIAIMFDNFVTVTNMDVVDACRAFTGIIMEMHGEEFKQHFKELGFMD
jgi:hypothetical protein